MGFGRADHGLHLCAKRILVQNDNRDLLPDYLRFLRGIVDSADLPLNVSREALQDNTVFRKMQRVITKKVLDHFDTFAEEHKEEYTRFYREFGGDPLLKAFQQTMRTATESQNFYDSDDKFDRPDFTRGVLQPGERGSGADLFRVWY